MELFGSGSSGCGVFPLGNDGVLKSQLMEYSEVTAMAEALYNGLDVYDLLKKLYKIVSQRFDFTKKACIVIFVTGVRKHERSKYINSFITKKV